MVENDDQQVRDFRQGEERGVEERHRRKTRRAPLLRHVFHGGGHALHETR
jgi:hypothetical protein